MVASLMASKLCHNFDILRYLSQCRLLNKLSHILESLPHSVKFIPRIGLVHCVIAEFGMGQNIISVIFKRLERPVCCIISESVHHGVLFSWCAGGRPAVCDLQKFIHTYPD
ncbi:unnamed protein product [Moneuplotes crassus]|uniref:Uncharacterized protein n=1 Tax=Euplotes crassus TaxID=5936 RepID=A0AAD1Y8U9_EUPCR|nr:unnamed protein product [Moneuplotes crassus]